MYHKKQIRFGIKLWSRNSNLLYKAEELINAGHFDYVEIMPVPNTDIEPFMQINLPYIIHATSETFGFNIADKTKKHLNLELFTESMKWMDNLKATYLVVHPGYGSLRDALDFMDMFSDKRILIENMPRFGLNGEKMLGYSVDEITQLMNDKYGFCLDLNHAIKAAAGLKIPYQPFVSKLLQLNPKLFHISDGDYRCVKDEHLPIGNGNYDFIFLKNCILRSASRFVTFETPRKNFNNLNEDIDNIKKIAFKKNLIKDYKKKPISMLKNRHNIKV